MSQRVSLSDEGGERGVSVINYVSQGPVYNIEVHSCGEFHAGNLESLTPDETTPPLTTIQGTPEKPRGPLENYLLIDSSELKERLKGFYKNLTLPRIVWLDDAEDLDIGEFFIDLKLDESGKSIKKEDIFNPVNEQRPTRILMEGQPGSGKTTLAMRIIYDWANDEEYVGQFQLVFLLPLRRLQRRSVVDAIKSIGNICGFEDSDKINEIIAHNEKHILFIFDGLDELPVEAREPILRLLYKQKYSDVTMLVTCRTGLFTLTKDEHSHLFEGLSRQSTFYNKKISILGIKNDEKKMEFLEKFIVTDESINEKIVADLKSTVSSTELFDCPLFLIMLAFIVNTEEEDVGIVLTTTELYKKLFNCVIKHSCGRNQIALDDCFDLFDCDSSPNGLRELIYKFGKLSLKHVLENNLQFKSDSLTQEIYKVGFLCNHKQVVRFKSTQKYEAYHLSILEFSAAYYAWMEYKSNKSELMEKMLKSVVQHYLRSRGTSLVLNFMIGLFQEHSGDIIDAIRPFSSCFCLNFHYVAQLIKECSSADVYKKIFPFMTQFLPVHLDLRMKFRLEMLSLKSFEKLIKYGIKCGKIKSVYVSNLIHSPCLLKLHFPCVKTRLDKVQDLSYILTHLQCVNELHIDISEATKNSKLSVADIKKFVSTIATFKSKTCALKLYCYDAAYMNPQMCVQLKESTFETPFYIFSIRIETNLEKLFAVTLLQKNQISFLKVYLPSRDLGLSDLFNAIAESTNLHSFMLDSNPANRDRTVIDLSVLTNGGTKKYEFLEFKNCIVHCSQPLINRNCIGILSINDISRVNFQEIEPENLHCRMSHVKELLEMNPRWPGVDSIKYISIRESNGCQIEDKRVFEFLFTCKNLQTLEISSRIFEGAQSLVEGLQEFAIEKFVYSFESFKQVNLFKTMNDNWVADKNLQLQSIDIIYKWESLISSTQSRNCVSSELLELLKGLQKQHWKRVNFVCYGRDTFLSLLNDRSIIDVSIFNVVHYLYGSDDDDPHYHKFLGKRNAVINVNAFAITLK